MKARNKWSMALLIGILLAVSGCANNTEDQTTSKQKTDTKFAIAEAPTFKLENIRGIGYPGNDDALYVAANSGLKMYKESKWFELTTNRHDLIGFQAVESGFIGSGHPQKGTGLKDPLGIVLSNDKGETVKKLAFYGDTYFHFMGASFSGNTLYVINQEENPGLSLGVNYSTDQGETWKKSALTGFDADSLGMIAVHPTKGETMAMATRSGIYYSNDYGNTMKLITGPLMVTAVTFNGDSLFYSGVDNDQIILRKLDPVSGEQTDLTFPFLDYDNPITYLAVNPKNQQQLAFTTYKNDLYQSLDGGANWENLLKDGK